MRRFTRQDDFIVEIRCNTCGSLAGGVYIGEDRRPVLVVNTLAPPFMLAHPTMADLVGNEVHKRKEGGLAEWDLPRRSDSFVNDEILSVRTSCAAKTHNRYLDPTIVDAKIHAWSIEKRKQKMGTVDAPPTAPGSMSLT